MKNIKRLSGYWMPVFTLLTLLIYVSTFPITAVDAAFDPTPALDPTLDEQSLPNVMLDQANPADSGGQSLARAVGCSQTDLIAAINAANSSPGESVIELPPGCLI